MNDLNNGYAKIDKCAQIVTKLHKKLTITYFFQLVVVAILDAFISALADPLP